MLKTLEIRENAEGAPASRRGRDHTSATKNIQKTPENDSARRSNIILKARAIGIELTNDMPELEAILELMKQREGEGCEFENAGASLALLIRRELSDLPKPKFSIVSYHVSMRRDEVKSICEATLKARIGLATHHTAAEGEGPVNALDAALRAALVKPYPKLKGVSLCDYNVGILQGIASTAARTRVLITSSNGKARWSTVGVSPNIVEASLQALTDSMEYALI